ncbi:MAG: DEAD/DEAH box helicase [Flavobacteriales bacterium]|nr:DEAD/DEAH box helicase [Flavobacteriales bacterium]MCB9168246.1 DEAD/DEAH box helicase [Flavobacteriales bacterium]
MRTFEQLGLVTPLLKALHEEGYETPTPIQTKAIPPLLAGHDLLGSAQTGTGKTAAFALPILQHLHENPSPSARGPVRVLVLTPTRELAIQIDESFAAYGRHIRPKHVVIFGGVGQKPQTDALQRGAAIVVATPGRLLDLMGQGFVDLSKLEVFVLDEADRMLDMGFIHDVRKVIAKLPSQRRTLLFSATMPNEIAKLAHAILRDPVRVEVSPVSSTADTIEQWMHFVERADKNRLLVHLLADSAIREALVFTRTKHGANKVAKVLVQNGITAEAIHGNKSQTARQKALRNFKAGTTRILVATDIAARGIDIDGLGHVINFDLPNVPETYVHRIGRTGRAGAAGRAISFCDQEERAYLRDITRLIGRTIPEARVEGLERTELRKMAPQQERREPRDGRKPQKVHRPGGRQRRNRSERSGDQSATSGERSTGKVSKDRNPARAQRSARPSEASQNERPASDRGAREKTYDRMMEELFGGQGTSEHGSTRHGANSGNRPEGGPRRRRRRR